MARLMAVSLTEQAVVDRRKTVTRRLGWQFLRPGQHLTLCRKVMGRRRGDGTVEPIVRLATVEVIDVRSEPLNAITLDDIEAEGVPWETWGTWCDPQIIASNLEPDDWERMCRHLWVRWFCRAQRVNPDTDVTRIEWRYIGETE